MNINVDDELRFFITKCTPRRPKVLIDGYGIRTLRHHINSYNEYITQLSSESAQLVYESLYGFSSSISEFEYAMGYPIDRLQFFLEKAAQFKLGCLKLRGSQDVLDVTTSTEKTNGVWTESLTDVHSYRDESLGSAAKAYPAVCAAWLSGNELLADEILANITFLDYDFETRGEDYVFALKALVALGKKDAIAAEQLLQRTSDSSSIAKIVNGILKKSNENFREGLKQVLEEAGELANSFLDDNRAWFEKKGLEVAPVKHWSIEAMGFILLARRNNFPTSFDHDFISTELMEAVGN